jgi:hypothetical protein
MNFWDEMAKAAKRIKEKEQSLCESAAPDGGEHFDSVEAYIKELPEMFKEVEKLQKQFLDYSRRMQETGYKNASRSEQEIFVKATLDFSDHCEWLRNFFKAGWKVLK